MLELTWYCWVIVPGYSIAEYFAIVVSEDKLLDQYMYTSDVNLHF